MEQDNKSGKLVFSCSPKHDLESLIYLLTTELGFKLPWDSEVVEECFSEVNDFIEFKSRVTDKQIINCLPEILVDPFKKIMSYANDEPINYQDIRDCFKFDVECSPKIDLKQDHVRLNSSKLCPVLLKTSSIVDDCEPESPLCIVQDDDSCHAQGLERYSTFTSHLETSMNISQK